MILHLYVPVNKEKYPTKSVLFNPCLPDIMGVMKRLGGIIFTAVFALLLLFPACGEGGDGEVGGKLVIKAPEQASVVSLK